MQCVLPTSAEHARCSRNREVPARPAFDDFEKLLELFLDPVHEPFQDSGKFIALDWLRGIIVGSVATCASFIFDAMVACHIEQRCIIKVAPDLREQPPAIPFTDRRVIDNHQPNAHELQKVEQFPGVAMPFQPPRQLYRQTDGTG